LLNGRIINILKFQQFGFVDLFFNANPFQTTSDFKLVIGFILISAGGTN